MNTTDSQSFRVMISESERNTLQNRLGTFVALNTGKCVNKGGIVWTKDSQKLGLATLTVTAFDITEYAYDQGGLAPTANLPFFAFLNLRGC
jgi:hypothetical protein